MTDLARWDGFPRGIERGEHNPSIGELLSIRLDPGNGLRQPACPARVEMELVDEQRMIVTRVVPINDENLGIVA